MKIPNDISEIAAIIKSDWKNISTEAEPHLKKMHYLHSIYDKYGNSSAKSIIRNFLNNARNWHGDTAREVKKTLREMIG
jgi:hypothetical protein